MSLVACPQCRKQVSSLARTCPHCGFKSGSLPDEERAEIEMRKARDRIYHLRMTSYVLITLLLVAIGWYWWGSSGFTRPAGYGPFLLMFGIALGYMVVRVLLLLAQRRLKQLL